MTPPPTQEDGQKANKQMDMCGQVLSGHVWTSAKKGNRARENDEARSEGAPNRNVQIRKARRPFFWSRCTTGTRGMCVNVGQYSPRREAPAGKGDPASGSRGQLSARQVPELSSQRSRPVQQGADRRPLQSGPTTRNPNPEAQ